MSLIAAFLLAGLPFHTELVRVDPATLLTNEGAGLAAPATLRPAPGAEDVRTTSVLRTARPFRDVLPSWNVDAAAGTGFVVELRVDATGAGDWSPWLHVGDWGDPSFAPPIASRAVAFPGGRIAVDVLEGERAFVAAQLRVRAFTRDAGGELVIRRLTLALRDETATVERAELPADRPLGRVLDVPARSQRTERPEIAGRICSPTSVAMVLAFRGVAASTSDVAARAHDPAHDLYGIWPRNVQTAWSFGVSGHVACFSDWAVVERSILAGTPLVVSLAAKEGELRGAPYASTPGHLIVLAGFDAQGDCVVVDPAASDPREARRTYARVDLERVWMLRGGTAYVLEARP
jgi:hypothetical protein